MGFDEDAVAVHRGEAELVGDGPVEIPDPGAGGHLEFLDKTERDRGGWTGFFGLLPVRQAAVCSYLLRVIGEENFVEDLGSVLLDGVQLHRMWRQLPGLHPAQRSRTPLLCHFVT